MVTGKQLKMSLYRAEKVLQPGSKVSLGVYGCSKVNSLSVTIHAAGEYAVVSGSSFPTS